MNRAPSRNRSRSPTPLQRMRPWILPASWKDSDFLEMLLDSCARFRIFLLEQIRLVYDFEETLRTRLAENQGKQILARIARAGITLDDGDP